MTIVVHDNGSRDGAQRSGFSAGDGLLERGAGSTQTRQFGEHYKLFVKVTRLQETHVQFGADMSESEDTRRRLRVTGRGQIMQAASFKIVRIDDVADVAVGINFGISRLERGAHVE